MTPQQAFDLFNFKLNHNTNSSTTENVPIQMTDGTHIQFEPPMFKESFHVSNILGMRINCLHFYANEIHIGVD